MATSRGGDAVKRFVTQLPDQIETKLLRGAARSGANVIADEARTRSVSEEVSGAIMVATKREETRMLGLVQVKGPGAFKAPWLEYGTDPHFISVVDTQRQGMSVRRINDLQRAGTLVINGRPVGKTVHHPGARPHPFLRPALDAKEAEAIAAAQAYIDARIGPAGVTPASDPGDEA